MALRTLALSVLALSASGLYAAPLQDQAQDKTQPPSGTELAVDPVIGRGVQIYLCQDVSGTPAWTFVAPQATLETPQGQPVGTHGAGPVWRWKDGSAVMGKLAEKHASPDGVSIPWLLLTATPAPDAKPGALAGVTYVRRAETQGGAIPTVGCDAMHIGAEAKVAYVAPYYFYKPATGQ